MPGVKHMHAGTQFIAELQQQGNLVVERPCTEDGLHEVGWAIINNEKFRLWHDTEMQPEDPRAALVHDHPIDAEAWRTRPALAAVRLRVQRQPRSREL